MSFLSKPLLILGAGGHASVLLDILLQRKQKVLAIVSPSIESDCQIFSKIEHFEDDDVVTQYASHSIKLVNGIGSLPGSKLRSRIYTKFKSLGYEFETIIAPTAAVSDFASIEEGVHILAGAVIQTGAKIGFNSIINSGAIVEHDCKVGSNNHIAPNATLSGHVRTAEHVHIGTGASIIQSVEIGNNSVVGAGAAITSNVAHHTICFPARVTKKVAT